MPPSARRRARTHQVGLSLAALLASAITFGPQPMAVAASTSIASTSIAPPPTVPAKGLLFGAFEPTAAGGTAADAVAARETQVGRTLGLDRSYWSWDDAQPGNIVTDDLAHGRTPLMSIKPQKRTGTVISWASIAAGAVDADIERQADQLAAAPGGIILALHHEPEIASGYGSASDYVAAFRHYVSVFRERGASNVAFAWILTPVTFERNADQWYPGDDVVDWIGTDAYNFGSCKAGVSGWRSIESAASAFQQWGSAHGKPLVLAEYGSAEDPADPGRKAQWLRDAAATFQAWPNLRAVSYFDTVGTCDWRLGLDAAGEGAFRELARTAYAMGSPSAWLRPSTAVGAAPLAQTFDLSQSAGANWPSGRGVASWVLDFGDGFSATGQGNPTSATHSYQAGTWTAALTVTGGTGGRSSTTHGTFAAAGPPTVSEGNASSMTSTGATLPAWIGTVGLGGTYRVEWGTTTTFGGSFTGPLSATALVQAKSYPLSGLAPGTRYYWRYVAITAAGTTYGPARWFTTTS
jgi:hypothetical protein